MGTITCVVDGADKALTFTSISEVGARDTWARFTDASFQIFGGGSFDLVFTVPYSTFRFDPSDPIAWPDGQPSWIQIVPGTTATSLSLQAESAQAGLSSTFTIRNSTTPDESITITLESGGGAGGAGGTIAAYLQNDRSVLIGPLPAGALAEGNHVDFGFRDQGGQQIVLSPGEGTVIQQLTWNPAQPDYIQVVNTADQVFILVNNAGANRLSARFTIGTNLGSIDPTIITNPDESAP